MPPRKILEVTWEDAAMTKSWDGEDPVPSTDVARTVGYLIERTKKQIVLGHEVFDGDGYWRCITAIPIGMVRKVRVLKGGAE